MEYSRVLLAPLALAVCATSLGNVDHGSVVRRLVMPQTGAPEIKPVDARQ